MALPLMGAILAAGRGTRMAPFGDFYPKPLLPLGNKPLIEYQIETMRGLGIEEIAVLIGHKGYLITKVLGDGSRFGVRLHYVEQTQMYGIAHALGRLEPVLDRPFLLMLGDIYFIEKDLGEMLRIFSERECACVLAAKMEPDPAAIRKNFAIQMDTDGRVTRVIEKPRHTTNRLKGVGLYLFDPVIFDAIRRTPRTAMRDEYELTDAIQVMIDDGNHTRVASCVEDDINLTSPADLLHCNLLVAHRAGHETITADSAMLHPGVRLQQAVIGPRVEVRQGIAIRRSVLLEGAVVDTDQDLDGMVISPERSVDVRSQFPRWPQGLGL
jgi:dTDP-glucose pyrophosphorylase